MMLDTKRGSLQTRKAAPAGATPVVEPADPVPAAIEVPVDKEARIDTPPKKSRVSEPATETGEYRNVLSCRTKRAGH